MTVHLSSQTYPKEIIDKLCKCGNLLAVFAAIENVSDKGNTSFLDGAIVSASGSMVDGQL